MNQIQQERLLELANAIIQEIKTRHSRRGFTTGKKKWELRLLQMAENAIAAPDGRMSLPLQ